MHMRRVDSRKHFFPGAGSLSSLHVISGDKSYCHYVEAAEGGAFLMTLDACIGAAIETALKGTREKGDPAVERLRKKLPRGGNADV